MKEKDQKATTSVSQSLRFDVLPTGGAQLQRHCAELESLVGSIRAQRAQGDFPEEKSSATTSSRSSREKGGIVSMASSEDCSAMPTASKFSAEPATSEKQTQKTKIAGELEKSLKQTLLNVKERLFIKAIERASCDILKEHHCFYEPDARNLAQIGPSELKAFIEEVERNRESLDVACASIMKQLGETT